MYWCCGKRRGLPAAQVPRATSTDAHDAPRAAWRATRKAARGPPGLERRKTTADLNPKQRLMPWTGPRPSCRDPRSAPGPGLGNFFIF